MHPMQWHGCGCSVMPYRQREDSRMLVRVIWTKSMIQDQLAWCVVRHQPRCTLPAAAPHLPSPWLRRDWLILRLSSSSFYPLSAERGWLRSTTDLQAGKQMYIFVKGQGTYIYIYIYNGGILIWESLPGLEPKCIKRTSILLAISQ